MKTRTRIQKFFKCQDMVQRLEFRYQYRIERAFQDALKRYGETELIRRRESVQNKIEKLKKYMAEL